MNFNTTLFKKGKLRTDCTTLINLSRSKFKPRIKDYSDFLEKKYKEVQVVDVTQNVWNPLKYSQFKYTLVINNKSCELLEQTGRLYQQKIDSKDEYKIIAENPDFKKVINELLKGNNRIYLLKYMNTFKFNFEENKAVTTISPNTKNVNFWMSKSNQFIRLKQTNIPLADFKIVNSEEKFWEAVKKFDFSVFVSTENGSSGKGNFIASGKHEINKGLNYLKSNNKTNIFNNMIISKKLNVEVSPSIGAITDGETTIVMGISEQILKKGTDYVGTIWPLPKDISEKQIKDMIEIVKVVGEELGKTGYKGIFNVDFMITTDGKVYFAEVNPRNFGHYPEMNKSVKYIIKHVNFAELDILIAEGNKLNDILDNNTNNTIKKIEYEMCYEPYKHNLAWIFKEYKNFSWDIIFKDDIENLDVDKIIKNKGIGCFDFPGTGIIIPKGQPAFHLVVASNDRKTVKEKLAQDSFFNRLLEKYELE